MSYSILWLRGIDRVGRGDRPETASKPETVGRSRESVAPAEPR